MDWRNNEGFQWQNGPFGHEIGWRSPRERGQIKGGNNMVADWGLENRLAKGEGGKLKGVAKSGGALYYNPDLTFTIIYENVM